MKTFFDKLARRSAAVLLSAALVFSMGDFSTYRGLSAYAADTDPTASPESDFTVENDGEGVKIKNYNGAGGDVVIPGTIDGKSVVSIGANAFLDNTAVTSVVIPEGVTTIKSQAFMGCTSLVTVSLPSTLQSFAVTAGGRAAGQFSDCSSLKTINIPAGITKKPKNCFHKCTSLESIALPDGVTSIDFGAFYGCSNLTKVEVPSTIETIDETAFYGHNINLQFLVPDEATKNKLSDWGYNATTCTHENVVDGVCVDCGQRMDDNVFEVTVGEEKTLYKTFGEALSYASGKTAVLKLLTNTATNDNYTSTAGDNITFDLDGHTLSYTGSEYYFLNLGKNCFITIKNGKVNSKMGMITCKDNAGFALDGVEITTGNFSGLMFPTGMNDDAPVCTINNSTFDGGVNTRAIDAYQLPFPKLNLSSGSCIFKNGIHVSANSTIAEFLDGKVLKGADGNWIYGEALMDYDIPQEVTVYDPPFTITKQPVGGTWYFDGKTDPKLSVEASDPNLSYTYQWYVDGEKVDHLHFSEIIAWLGDHTYYCEVTADGYTVKSDTVTFDQRQSGTEIIAHADQPNYTYGDTITVTATAAPTGKAPEAALNAAADTPLTPPVSDEMALFYNGKQVSEAVTPVDRLGNRFYTMTASTADIVNAGADCWNPTLLTARFVGNPYMADAEATVEVRIQRAEITITGATIAEKTYDGTTTAEVTSVTFDGLVGDDSLELGVDITATAEFDTPRAGTGKDVTVTVDAIYGGKAYLRYICKDNTFTLTDQEIKKAQQTLTVPETTFEKTYGDSEFSLGCSTNGDGEISYEVNGGEDVISVSRSGDVKIIGIGSAEVTVTLSEGTNYTGEDSETISIIVAKGAVDVPAADNTNFTYNGTEQTYKIAASDLYTVEGNKKKNAGSYIVKVTLNDPDHYEWKTELPVYEFVINKAAADVPKADNTTFIYNGKEQTYTIAQSGLYTVTNNTRTNAGSQTVTVTLKDTANYKWKTELPTYTFEIKKAAVTVTADSFTIKAGDSLPALTYTSEGLKGTDKIDDIGANITIRYEKDEIPSGVGEYKIVVSGKAETTNYKITYVDGTLTISEKPVVADPVINPNGGTFSSSQTVTITCDTKGADIYYTTDGKDPTTASKKYNGAFKVTKTTTVKAIAVMNGTEKSAVVSAKFTIDRGPNPPADPGRPRPAKPTEPTEPQYPKINGKEISWTDTTKQIQDLPDSGKLTIELNGNTTVPAVVIAAIANKNAVVTFVLNAEISFVIDGAKISGKVSAADLTVGLSKTMLSTTNFRVIGGTAEKQFTLGSIDIPAKMSFELNKANAGKFASLMKLNSTTGKYEFVSAAKITADGTALVDINGKGDYLLIVDTETKKPGDLNNDMITNALDASELLKSIVYELSMNSFKADYNIDGTATAMDASEILKAIVG